jgi:four helix bundle protein
MRKKAQSHRDLGVWQRSMDLTLAVYRLTQGFPREEAFGLTSQMRRSAVSIPSNIAEGFGRMSRREFNRFLLIARGSNCELQTQLEISKALGLGELKQLGISESLSHEVGKTLFSLLGSLKSSDG